MTKELTKAASYPVIRELFESADVQTQLSRSTFGKFKVDTLCRIALTTIRTSADLQDCTQLSLLACLFGSAQLQLYPEKYLGQCAYVPLWNRKVKPKIREANFWPMYRGLITLARRSGELDLMADIVFENDYFKMMKGLKPTLEHCDADGDRGEIKGAYAVFYFPGNRQPTFNYMNKARIDKIRDRSPAKDSGPWVTDYEEMAKIRPIKNGFKLLPTSIEDKSLALASAADDLAMIGGDQTKLFLPEDKALEVKYRDVDSEFDSHFIALTPKTKLATFISLAMESNQKSDREVKLDALENPEQFSGMFERWKKQNPTKRRAAGKSKKDEGKDTGTGTKGASAANGEASEAKKKATSGKIKYQDLIQTKQWQEMSMLQETEPEIWVAVTKGEVPNSIEAVEKMIDKIYADIKDRDESSGSGDDMPGA